ncbi:MAG: 50S ribosomal protein L29 [Chlamydiota bacterium]
MLKKQEIRDQTLEELVVLNQDLSKEIYDLMNEFRQTRKMERPHLIREKKKTRARVLTIIKEKGATK